MDENMWFFVFDLFVCIVVMWVDVGVFFSVFFTFWLWIMVVVGLVFRCFCL